MAGSLRATARDIRRALGLSPMQRVLRSLERSGVDVGSLDALEVYGETGMYHTVDFAPRVRSLEVWELDAAHKEALRRRFPNATIRTVDSYEQVHLSDDRFGLIVIDNPMSIHEGHCEHFDLFPGVFRLALRESPPGSIFIVNVIPTATKGSLRRFPYLFSMRQLEQRGSFYDTASPENIPPAEMLATYRALARQAGLSLDWSFTVRRHFVYYLVFGLTPGATARAQF